MQLEMNKVHFMNNMEGMKQIPSNYFDLAIVDPPYGILEIAHRTLGASKLAKTKEYDMTWDEQSPDKEYFIELMRVSKHQIIWGANHFISKIPFDASCWIVWDKCNTGNFADAELAWTSFETAVRIFKFRWNGMLQQNMKDKEKRIHPTQKPVQLYKWLLNKYAKPEYKIIDTHVGSGSSILAFEEYKQTNHEFEYIGFENKIEFYTSQQKRLQEYKNSGIKLIQFEK